VTIADTSVQTSPKAGDSSSEAPQEPNSKLRQARESVLEAIAETERAIAKQTGYLKEKLAEIETSLADSVWSNPWL
jgi:hypothetical protein